MARLEPIHERPILAIHGRWRTPPTLVIADLHLGLSSPEGTPARSAERWAWEMTRELLETASSVGARRLIVAGDVKHPIVGAPPALRSVLFDFFSTLLSGGLQVEVVLGNHDVGLTKFLPREVAVRPSLGIVRDGVGVFHGHCWPSSRVLGAERLVVGHLHPGFRFAPTAEETVPKRRCWVRVRNLVDLEGPGRRLPNPSARRREMIVLPAFHPFAGTESLNRDRPARGRSFLFRHFIEKGSARAYLLDGTDLGPIPRLPVPAPR